MGMGHGFLARSQWGQRAGPERAGEARLQDIWAGGGCKIFVQEVGARLCVALGLRMGSHSLREQGAWQGPGWGRDPEAPERSWQTPPGAEGDTEAAR